MLNTVVDSYIITYDIMLNKMPATLEAFNFIMKGNVGYIDTFIKEKETRRWTPQFIHNIIDDNNLLNDDIRNELFPYLFSKK